MMERCGVPAAGLSHPAHTGGVFAPPLLLLWWVRKVHEISKTMGS